MVTSPARGELYYPVSTQLYREYFINHCNKDHYLPISIMECHGGFDHCSTVPRSLRSAPGLLHLGEQMTSDFMLTIKLWAIFLVKDFGIIFECFRIQPKTPGSWKPCNFLKDIGLDATNSASSSAIWVENFAHVDANSNEMNRNLRWVRMEIAQTKSLQRH